MKISQRLGSSMVMIAALSVLMAVGFIYGSTRTLFNDYLHQTMSRQNQRWVETAGSYYQQNNTWEGFQEIISSSADPANMMPGQGFRRGVNGTGGGMHYGMVSSGLLVADSTGLIVADTSGTRLGQKLTSEEMNSAQPVTAAGEIVGHMLIPGGAYQVLGDLELGFVTRTARYAVLSALIATILALLLGYLLSRRISGPIANLASATHRLAAGDLTTRAVLEGDREIIELSRNFNSMAQRLEETRTIRDNLTADLIHELKTPLAIVRGSLESMQSGVIPAGEETLMSLQDELIRLSKLVEDLELLSRAESGRLPLEMGSYTVYELVDNLFPIINSMESEGKTFLTRLAPDLLPLCVDKHRILQVIINLLTNAMLHTPPGGVITMAAWMETPHELHLTIEDNGSGIDTSDLPYIFDRFYRADPSRSRRQGGTGLGLAIAKGFVEAHGGRIWADSTPGQGSTFHLLLPSSDQ